MTEMLKRLAELPPERRKALAELVKSRARSAPAGAAAPPPAPMGDDITGSKAEWRGFYNEVTAKLNSTMFGQFSYFLNYGYKPDGEREYAVVPLPEAYINRNSVKLVLELIGDCPVEGKRVLDVGCGRGGTVHVFQTFFKPSSIRGLDLSPAAIEFDRTAHKRADTTFFEGDAENLPFEDGSVDIVTNVESSHSYPNINRFYSEVHRVLAPGGHFLYTDLLSDQRRAFGLDYLQHIGFALELERDITRNVMLSCNDIAALRVDAFGPGSPSSTIDVHNFLATPGSDVYAKMATGEWRYFILRLRKTR